MTKSKAYQVTPVKPEDMPVFYRLGERDEDGKLILNSETLLVRLPENIVDDYKTIMKLLRRVQKMIEHNYLQKSLSLTVKK